MMPSRSLFYVLAATVLLFAAFTVRLLAQEPSVTSTPVVERITLTGSPTSEPTQTASLTLTPTIGHTEITRSPSATSTISPPSATPSATQSEAPTETLVSATHTALPESTPEITATIAVEQTAETTPESTRVMTAEVTAEMTPQLTTEMTPEVTSTLPASATIEATSEMTPEVTAEAQIGMPTEANTIAIQQPEIVREITCTVDVNFDGILTQADMTILLSQYGNVGLNNPADVNDDNQVNLLDYAALIEAMQNCEAK